MKTRRSRINRVLSRPSKAVANADARRHDTDAPRRLGPTLIDFSRLPLPAALRQALADAFWSHERARSEASLRGYWHSVKAFGRFAQETKAVRGLSDVNSVMLARYLEWINRQVGPDGVPWHVTTRCRSWETNVPRSTDFDHVSEASASSTSYASRGEWDRSKSRRSTPCV